MSNRFFGSYRAIAAKPATGKPRGIARANRAMKCEEAEARNAATKPEKRRNFARQFGYKRNSDRIRNGLDL